jgi:hypothetical protein
VLNGLVKLASIALALLVALVLLDMSFSLVSVGIGGHGGDETSDPGTAGDAATGPGNTGQADEASPGSDSGSGSAGDSNPLSGMDGSVPEIPKEVLAPLGLLWWVMDNSGVTVPGADGNASLPDNANSPGANASMPAAGATGIPSAPGPTSASTDSTIQPGFSPGAASGPSPGTSGAGKATLSPESGNVSEPDTDGMQDIMNGVPDWMIPVLGGIDWIMNGGNGDSETDYDTSTPVQLPDGTVIPDSVSLADTITGISGYSKPITKGVTFAVNGTVTGTDGRPVKGIIVDIFLAKDKASPDWINCGRAIAIDGVFGAECHTPNNLTPGDYNLIARSLDNRLYRGSDSDPVVELVAETLLSVEAPHNVRSGDACQVSVTLIDRVSGLPVEGQPIDVSIGSFSGRGITDEQGIARVNAESLPDSTMTIVATYPGQEGYLGSTAQQTVTVAPLNLLELFLYGLLALVVLLIMAAIVFLAYGAWEKRRGMLDRLSPQSRREPFFEAVPVRKEAFVPGTPSPYVISFPEIDRLLPTVWGRGEELIVRIDGIPQKPVSLAVDGQICWELKMDEGEALVPLIMEKGDHVLSVVPAEGGEELAYARVRIVDYREEVVRLFNELYHRLCSQFETTTELATPREFLGTVGPCVPDGGDRLLDRVITIFEVANYSLHGIGRNDYVTSYLSIRELAL